jgi:hypothetical protein
MPGCEWPIIRWLQQIWFRSSVVMWVLRFRCLNDLKDWQGDTDNKLVAGQDALALRPTVLLALALKDANEQQRAELKEILSETPGRSTNHKRVDRLREIFKACDVFEKAEMLVERSREKAESLVADIEDDSDSRSAAFLYRDGAGERSAANSTGRKSRRVCPAGYSNQWQPQPVANYWWNSHGRCHMFSHRCPGLAAC